MRLIANHGDRIKVMAEKLGVASNEAARQLEALERERNGFVREFLKKDPISPDDYDLILNTSRFSVKATASLLRETLEQLER